MVVSKTLTDLVASYPTEDIARDVTFEELYEEVQAIMESIEYLEKVEGRNKYLEQYLLALSHWFKVDGEKIDLAKDIAALIEYSLCNFQDFFRKAETRRGHQVAFKKFPEDMTLNTAMYVLFVAVRLCEKLSPPDGKYVLNDGYIRGFHGMGVENMWEVEKTVPTEDDYINMSALKVGAFLEAAFELLGREAKDKEIVKTVKNALGEIDDFGAYVQICWDIANLKYTKSGKNLDIFEDIAEGRMSFPMVYALNKHPEDDRIMKILEEKPKDAAKKQEMIKILEGYGAIEYAEKVLQNYVADLKQKLKGLPPNPVADKLIDDVFNPDKIQL